MANESEYQLNAEVLADIVPNANNEITAQQLQDILVNFIDSLNTVNYEAAKEIKSGRLVLYTVGSQLKLYRTIAVVNTADVGDENPVANPEKYELVIGDTGTDGIVLDITDLKAVTGYSQDTQYVVTENAKVYTFSATSTATPDDIDVVKPDDITLPAAGRWLTVGQYVTTATTGELTNLNTTDKSDFVNAINEVNTLALSKPDLGETATDAYRGDRGKTAYDHSQLTSGNPHSVALGDLTGLDILNGTADRKLETSTSVLPDAPTELDLNTYDLLVFNRLNDGQVVTLTNIRSRRFYVLNVPNTEGSFAAAPFTGDDITGNIWAGDINQSDFNNSIYTLLECEIKQYDSEFKVFITLVAQEAIYLKASGVSDKAETDGSNIIQGAFLIALALNNVDNTADLNKIISNPTQAALNLKLTDVFAGTNISIDKTDPLNPIINASGAVTEFLDNIFRVVSNSNGFKLAFLLDSLTANRTFSLLDKDYTFADDAEVIKTLDSGLTKTGANGRWNGLLKEDVNIDAYDNPTVRNILIGSAAQGSHLKLGNDGIVQLFTGTGTLGGTFTVSTDEIKFITNTGLDFSIHGNNDTATITTNGGANFSVDGINDLIFVGTATGTSMTIEGNSADIASLSTNGGQSIEIDGDANTITNTGDTTVTGNLQATKQAHGGSSIELFSASKTFDAEDGNVQSMDVTASTNIGITNELPGTYIFILTIATGTPPTITIGASFGDVLDGSADLIYANGDVNILTLVVSPNSPSNLNYYTITTKTA